MRLSFFQHFAIVNPMALYLVSGKGGVGKTHLSLSLAHHLKSQGKRVLLVEFSGNNQFSQFFGINVNFTGIEFQKNLLLASWNGLDCLKEYAGKVLGSERLVQFFMSHQMMQNLMQVAPGLREIAILGKVTSTFRNSGFSADYTDVVLDAPSSGHFTSLLQVPFGLSQAIKSGPMATQCKSIIETLLDPQLTKLILISLPRELSLNETKESGEQVHHLLKRKPFQILNQAQKTKEGYDGVFPILRKKTWTESSEALAPYWESLF